MRATGTALRAGGLITAIALIVVAWSMGAFGAVYPWAYWPTLAGCGSVILAELIARVRSKTGQVKGGRSSASLVIMLALLCLAIGFQLVPIPGTVIARLSPALDRLVQQQSLGYVVTSPLRTHPLSINPAATRRGLLFVAVLAAFFLALRSALKREPLTPLVHAIAGLGVMASLVALAQRAMFNGKVYGVWQPMGSGATIFGPFINHNHFAGWMLLAISLQLGYFCGLAERALPRMGPTVRERVLWLQSRLGGRLVAMAFAIAICAVAVVFSLSRSGICSLMMAFALVGLRWMQRSRRRSLVVAPALFVVAIPAMAIAWAGTDYVGERFANTRTELPFRLGIWKDAVRIVRDTLLIGTGFNTFGTATLYYQTTEPSIHFAEAHNDYLQLASEGGLLLLVPAAGVLVVFGRLVKRQFAEPQDEVTSWTRVGAVAGLVAIALQSLVEFSLQMPANSVLFAVVAAIASHDAPPLLNRSTVRSARL